VARDVRSKGESPVRDCERFLAFLQEACPPITVGLREGLAPLPVDVRAVFLQMLSHLVRSAPSHSFGPLSDFTDLSGRRYYANRRLIERLRRRDEFCGVKAAFIMEQVDCLHRGIEISTGRQELAYNFAATLMVRLLGHLIRAEAGISIVPDLPKPAPEPKHTAPGGESRALPCIPPPPPRLAQVLPFPKRRPT
jgi:hypothetical protein